MILLDMHVLVWLWTDAYHLGKSTRRMMDVGLWRRELLGQGLAVIPVGGEIGIRANALPDFHTDPADRIIVSTALAGH